MLRSIAGLHVLALALSIGILQGLETSTANALTRDWDSCFQDATHDAEEPEPESATSATWNGWDECETCTEEMDSAEAHTFTILFDAHNFDCGELQVQNLLAWLDIQFCATIPSMTTYDPIGTVTWFWSGGTYGTTPLFYFGLEDNPYPEPDRSIARAEVDCSSSGAGDFVIFETHPITKVVIQWDTVSGGDSPAKGNAPMGFNFTQTCCNF